SGELQENRTGILDYRIAGTYLFSRPYLSGYNLFTITGLKYCDPEFPSGNYGYNYPLNKTVTIGANLKF
ncbi:hypothetical protein AAH055_01940, partial [Bacteroides uniformis]|uniref:hypothetical protein n=1 Tax=Bacteroides uniformis TaxID=820 RepID=UPI0039B460BE